jgi:ATP-binding cassette subfamily C (CFTR/MRP) protein 10
VCACLQVLGHRHEELRALAVRKYLDALCVYFWAATQLLLSGTTFGLMVLLGQPLRSGAAAVTVAAAAAAALLLLQSA